MDDTRVDLMLGSKSSQVKYRNFGRTMHTRSPSLDEKGTVRVRNGVRCRAVRGTVQFV